VQSRPELSSVQFTIKQFKVTQNEDEALVYNLDALGWYQFEHLCQALLKDQLGLAVEAWGGSGDLGRDAYFEGSLRFPNPHEDSEGPFLFQAKFVSNANAVGAQPRSALLGGVRAECARIRERSREAPNHYVLLTNVPLTPGLRTDVEHLLSNALPTTTIHLQGATDIEALLDGQPSIRTSYPQILGLRDLQYLLRSETLRGIVQRSAFTMEAAERLAPRFVPTSAYSKALSVLSKQRFAVLLGPPEMGKTAAALMIGLARLTSGWDVFNCKGPADFFDAYDPGHKQLFLADDAFGSTEYRPGIAMDWAADLHTIVDKLNSDHHLLWTSRPAPLREGLRQIHLQGSVSTFPTSQEIEVNAAFLTIPEKAQMLYRHAKSSDLDELGINVIRENAASIISDPHFTPLRIDRFVRTQLGDLLSRGMGSLTADSLATAISIELQTPTSAMTTSLEALDAEHRAVLIAFLNGGQEMELTDLSQLCESFIGRPFSRSVTSVAEDLDDHFIEISEPRRGVRNVRR